MSNMQIRYFPDSHFDAKPPMIEPLPEHLRAEALTEFCTLTFGHVDHVRYDARRRGWAVYTLQPRSRQMLKIMRRDRMTTETKRWHQAPSALCYCITNNDDECMSAEYANALEACAEALRTEAWAECHLCFAGGEGEHEVDCRVAAALARLDALREDGR